MSAAADYANNTDAARAGPAADAHVPSGGGGDGGGEDIGKTEGEGGGSGGGDDAAEKEVYGFQP